ncbi:MAG: type 4a pilus biogenesis protein PilO [Candidatus Coatesbacteria bacterium]|nr:type 4a pilus biogenesis protein PilO [Candidatus Coatesbacteria bacterium]
MALGQFNELPAGARIGIVAGGAVVLLVIIYFVLFGPIISETDDLKTLTEREQGKIAKAKELLSHLPEKKLLLARMKEEAKVLMLKVPDTYNLPTVLEQFASTAQRASINELPMKQLDSYPSTLPGSDLTFYVIPIRVDNLYCRFKDLIGFIEGLEYLDRLVNIKWIDARRMTPEEKGGDLDVPGIRVVMELETYQLQESADVVTSESDIGGSADF